MIFIYLSKDEASSFVALDSLVKRHCQILQTLVEVQKGLLWFALLGGYCWCWIQLESCVVHEGHLIETPLQAKLLFFCYDVLVKVKALLLTGKNNGLHRHMICLFEQVCCLFSDSLGINLLLHPVLMNGSRLIYWPLFVCNFHKYAVSFQSLDCLSVQVSSQV